MRRPRPGLYIASEPGNRIAQRYAGIIGGGKVTKGRDILAALTGIVDAEKNFTIIKKKKGKIEGPFQS